MCRGAVGRKWQNHQQEQISGDLREHGIFFGKMERVTTACGEAEAGEEGGKLSKRQCEKAGWNRRGMDWESLDSF